MQQCKGQRLSGQEPKNTGNKSKNKQDCIKLKSLCTIKEPINKGCEETTFGMGTIVKFTSNEGLISKIFKELNALARVDTCQKKTYTYPTGM